MEIKGDELMTTSNYTVLIIEDEKNISDFMSKALKSNDYRVIKIGRAHV